jgi:hypothetical protein
MIWTIITVLLALWIVGMISHYTMGGFLHILLAFFIAIGLYRFMQGRRGSVL